MMNHYTTFYRPPTTDIPAGHTAPTPASPLGLTPNALPPRTLDDKQFDRWINSQASIVDHPRVAKDKSRSPGFQDRTLSFSHSEDPPTDVPSLELDSAGTALSSTGPATPPPPPAFRDTDHYNGNPFALSEDATLPLAHLAGPDKTLCATQESDIVPDLLTSITHIVNPSNAILPASPTSASTLHVHVADPSPPRPLNETSKRKTKRQRRAHTPTPSSPRPSKPAKRAKKVRAPVQPLADIFTINPADITLSGSTTTTTSQIDRTWAGEGEHRARYGFVLPDTPGPMPGSAANANLGLGVKEGNGQDQREPLEVLASAGARRRQTDSPAGSVSAVNVNGTVNDGKDANSGDVEGGMDIEDKSWMLSQ